MNYYVYKFVDKCGNTLYVGQTIDMDRRMSEHKGKKWDEEKDHIEYAICNNQVDMCLYEMYYINKLEAKYNDSLVYNEKPTVELPELDFKRYEMKIIEEIHQTVINNAKKDFFNSFNPENYWTNKKKELEEKLEDATDDERDEIIKKINNCNAMLDER